METTKGIKSDKFEINIQLLGAKEDENIVEEDFILEIGLNDQS